MTEGMNMTSNIWGTSNVVSIASAVELELCVLAASVDGTMVEQIQFAPVGDEQEGRVLRASQGYALELCADHVRIYTAGAGSRYASVALSALVYAGDYSATADEIDAARIQDESTKVTRVMRKVAA